MTQPTKEYLQAKADLCEKTAISQILNGNTDEGVKNLMRMVNALNEIGLRNE